MKALVGGLLLIIAFLIHFYLPPLQQNPSPVNANQSFQMQTVENLQPIKTESKFTEKLSESTEDIPKNTVYKDDPDKETGLEIVLDEGADGKKTTITKITYYDSQEYNKEVVGTDLTPAKDKIISRGTKIIWKTLATPEGEIRYWKKLRVYATHYDSNCKGCNEWTSIGMRQGKGVIAVDPKVIKYRTKVYVPGYGMAVAGDTGGAIKGNIIDLGFEDAKTAGWKAKFVDIYLLN